MDTTGNSEELQDRIKTIANLPTLPHIASRLMNIVHSPDTSASSIAALVAQDVSLSAKVLRLANSAFYGVPRSINTLTNAVVILGFNVIQTMVLSLTVFDMFGSDASDDAEIFDRDAFWRHSLMCAATSRLLAQKRKGNYTSDPEEAFCAGLLHDIGKIVMEQYLNADFHKALYHAKISEKEGFEAEREVLGYTHCDVAKWLTATWSLPDRILQPILHHHTPESVADCADSVMICHIANTISIATSVASLENTAQELESKAQTIGLSAKDLEEVMISIPEEMEKASMFLHRK